MPFIPQETYESDLFLGLWQVEETEEYFLSRLNIYENEERILASITHPRARLEWLSSRLCLKELLDIRHRVESLNESTGRPYLSDRSFHISYSHTQGYSAAIASVGRRVSIDLENTTKARKTETKYLFMSPDELEWSAQLGDLRAFFLIWSAKETLYKIHGNRGLVFKENLIVNPERKHLEQYGTVSGIIRENGKIKEYPICYRFFPDTILTYTFADPA
jgi:phosphopantetheinyl transferase